MSRAASSPVSTPIFRLPFISNFCVGLNVLIPKLPSLLILTTGLALTGVRISIVPAPANSSIPLVPSTKALNVFTVPSSIP